MDTIINKYNKGENVDLDKFDIVDISASLKKYFRSQNPLLTKE